MSEVLPINANEAERTTTARLDFTPTQKFLELLRPFIKSEIQDTVLDNLKISTDAEAQLHPLPIGGQLTHIPDEENALRDYVRKLDTISEQQFLFDNNVSANRDPRGNVNYRFNLLMSDLQRNAVTSFEPFRLSRISNQLAVHATIPLRYITSDRERQLKAQFDLKEAFKPTHPAERARQGLFVRNVRWAERINLFRVADNDEHPLEAS